MESYAPIGGEQPQRATVQTEVDIPVLGVAFERFRACRNMSKAALAAYLGITTAQLRRLALCRPPQTPEQRRYLCWAFGISEQKLDELLQEVRAIMSRPAESERELVHG
jgi:hypothetical protein